MPPYLRTLASLLRNFTFADLVDVLCVACVFFALLSLLNTSRTRYALRNLVAILLASFAIYFAAQVMELSALALVFSRFWTVAIIIYLIVYQAELRRAFESASRGSFFSVFMGHRSKSAATLAKAVARLSEKQLGALFIIERDDNVDEHLVDPGEEIDALINEDLIVTLFFSYNPLHDGAAILRGDRIARAATKLPITKGSENLPKGLGTRHHAGMEFTTLCDALAVIVSEETGLVSVVENGVLERGLGEDALRARLESSLDARHGAERKEEEHG